MKVVFNLFEAAWPFVQLHSNMWLQHIYTIHWNTCCTTDHSEPDSVQLEHNLASWNPLAVKASCTGASVCRAAWTQQLSKIPPSVLENHNQAWRHLPTFILWLKQLIVSYCFRRETVQRKRNLMNQQENSCILHHFLNKQQKYYPSRVVLTNAY